jgi:hypothetical protein
MAIWMGGGLILGILTVELSPVFLFPLLLLMLVVATAGFRLRCPRCRENPWKLNPDLLMSPYRSWLPFECPKCGVPTSSEWPPDEARLARRGIANHDHGFRGFYGFFQTADGRRYTQIGICVSHARSRRRREPGQPTSRA